jgi:hypothetical protein
VGEETDIKAANRNKRAKLCQNSERTRNISIRYEGRGLIIQVRKGF